MYWSGDDLWVYVCKNCGLQPDGSHDARETPSRCHRYCDHCLLISREMPCDYEAGHGQNHMCKRCKTRQELYLAIVQASAEDYFAAIDAANLSRDDNAIQGNIKGI